MKPWVLAGLGVALTAPGAWASGMMQINTFVAQIHSARGHFVQQHSQQKQNNTNTGSKKTSPSGSLRGTFLFLRPGKFIWSYQEPYEQIIQSDSQYLYIYDKDLNQVIKRKLDHAIEASPVAILFGRHDLEQDFTLRDIAADAGIDWVELTPKAEGSQFKQIRIGFYQGQLQQMKLYDVFDNITLITLSQIEKNPPLSPKQFKFTAPKNAEIVQD
jgi:outer membrane lipoprotein carrier protein